MTREHKLALIVGFALVLIVGIAISDHFSKARVTKLGAAALPVGTPREFGAPMDAPSAPLGPAPTVQTKPAAGGMLSASDQGRFSVAPTGRAPDEIEMGPGSGKRVVMGPPIPEGFEVVPPRDRTVMPPAAQTDKPVSKGAMKTYEVKSQDTLYKLASKFYGDASLWKQLAEYNKGRVGERAALKLGTTLQIPPKDVLLGEAVLGAQAPGSKPPVPAGGSPKPATATKTAPETAVAAQTEPEKKGKYTTYTVKQGEDLSTIAKRLLGSARRMQEIVELNPDVLDDADTLAAGVSLKIPTK